MSDAFRSDELFACHIPAIELLVKLGYHFLTPEQALVARGGRQDGVLLDEIVRQQLPQINRIHYLDQDYPFSESNLATAFDKLKDLEDFGLAANNAAIYQLLVMGLTLKQAVQGDHKAYAFRYIDWEQPEKNRFHLVADFVIDQPPQRQVKKFDAVLFVNGIPFVVIKCLAPRCPVDLAQDFLQQAQNERHTTHLFHFAHFMLALNGREATVAAVGRHTPLWSVWREAIPDEPLQALHTQVLSQSNKVALYDLAQSRLGPRAQQERAIYQTTWHATQQDQTLYAMCRPQRLLELVREATLFDAGERKLARSNQYFAVQRALKRVHQWQENGQRQSGIMIHAEGSGKSLLMLFFARQLALTPDCQQARIVLISHQPNWGEQIGNSFGICPMQPQRVYSSRQLLQAIANDTPKIILSLPYGVTSASGTRRNRSSSNQIFFLIDEDHRQALGSYDLVLRDMFPNACYVGFSGTPLQRHERQLPVINCYSARQAQNDGLLVPLLYEARNAELGHDAQRFVEWLERNASDYNAVDKQKLQHVFEKSRNMAPAERRLVDIALDICLHFRNNYRGSGLKAQLVAVNNGNAFDFKRLLDELGQVDSTVITSKDSILAEKAAAAAEAVGLAEHELLNQYWRKLFEPYGNEDAFRHQMQQQFISQEKPELLIVVNQLDPCTHSPNNAVLYLVCKLSGQSFLQAVASVGQTAPDKPKPWGHVIEYVDEANAMATQSASGPINHPALVNFEPSDLQDMLVSATPQIAQLPASHAHLWALFHVAKASDTQEVFGRELRLSALRNEFHQRFGRYCDALNVALGNADFMRATPMVSLTEYRQDALRFFDLKIVLPVRYGEAAHFSAAERMLWQQLVGPQRLLSVPEIHILDPNRTTETLREIGLTSHCAQADAIVHHILRYLEQLQEPHNQAHQRLSQQAREVLEAVLARRIEHDEDYLAQVNQLYQQLLHIVLGPAPGQALEQDGLMLALYAMILPMLNPDHPAQHDHWARTAASTFCAYLAPVKSALVTLAQKREITNQIDDYLYDVMEKHQQAKLSSAQKDHVLNQAWQLAQQYRRPIS